MLSTFPSLESLHTRAVERRLYIVIKPIPRVASSTLSRNNNTTRAAKTKAFLLCRPRLTSLKYAKREILTNACFKGKLKRERQSPNGLHRFHVTFQNFSFRAVSAPRAKIYPHARQVPLRVRMGSKTSSYRRTSFLSGRQLSRLGPRVLSQISFCNSCFRNWCTIFVRFVPACFDRCLHTPGHIESGLSFFQILRQTVF